tara:strand:- start:1856 stop:2122 length:267 start_codon:yes stop_codon:yes gene_type:complete
MPELTRREKRVIGDKGELTQDPAMVFTKIIHLSIQGTNADEVNKTAKDIYSMATDETYGGKENRKTQITPMYSTDVIKTFHGKVRTHR